MLSICGFSRILNSLLKSRGCSTAINQFVPKVDKRLDNDVLMQLRDFVERSRRLFVLTGAGISTESGIRDYRSEGVGLYAVSKNRPIEHQEFVTSASRRQRYWARNYVGWPTFSTHQPNQGHRVLAELERVGKLHWLVTQNVDWLHLKAGSKRLTELHGATNRVICLMCGSKSRREDLQVEMKKLNPNFHVSPDIVGPDGDVFLSDDLVQNFKVPDCQNCGGLLKPDVVFFGGSVPHDKVSFVRERLKESDAVLTLGSSLQVYSAYRFIVAAHEQKIPLAIVNIGPTRADGLANLRVHCRIGEIASILNEFVV
ncbi:NAD-dependent protein lipoamidase sirtuin-4, mitochondrial-like [Dendronephthya gigantea]|uniref:NAD-dependent protein lipoamidase sirtuin-4, mitochondrial-like n=1 Tax=Dendronephthya gigantea TaxID=151771 RepID=UPI00106B082C|nr:NAD-dependent protein lipoamidase sirtuin-4, mitochondrial-like [Dendronephthya gigantea]